MIYRARNITSGATVLAGEEFVAANDAPEWVLEFEVAAEEWHVSGFHCKDITGVTDPRSFTEIKEALVGV